MTLPMSLSMRTWQVDRQCKCGLWSVDIVFKIDEKYVEKDSRETAIGDSKWQKVADPEEMAYY